ncbi:MAG: D-alanyl-D-alanine carboxypeptidase family protein [Steroidobacteraceae bacterium]
MNRLLASILLASSLALSSTAAFAATSSIPVPSPPQVQANGYILLDYASGRVLAEQRSAERMDPASITKLMTAYLVFKALKEKRLRLDEGVLVSERAWRIGGAVSDGSTSFIPVNSRVKAEDLIKGMIVQSGNDATIALAERLGGTEPAFVEQMNSAAKNLGMKGTNFDNSWGGPSPVHYSSAADIAVLSRALIKEFPEYYRYYSMQEFTFNGHTQRNRNGLLTRGIGVDGLKTGHTQSAKYCLVTSAKRNNMRLVSVVLGSPSIKAREDASAALLNYGFTFYETVKLHEGRKMMLKPRIYKGTEEFLSVGTTSDLYVTVARGEGGALLKNAEVKGPLMAPIKKDATVGEFTVSAGGQVIAHQPLVALVEVPEGGLFHRLSDSVRLWFQ